MQVSSAVLAGMVWALENPNEGIVEADEMDFRRCLEIQLPYLGPVKGFYTDWTPLTDRPGLFPEDIDTSAIRGSSGTCWCGETHRRPVACMSGATAGPPLHATRIPDIAALIRATKPHVIASEALCGFDWLVRSETGRESLISCKRIIDVNYGSACRTSSTFALALLCFFCAVGVASAQQCMTSYYRAKAPACLDEVSGRNSGRCRPTHGPNPARQSAFLPGYSGTPLRSASVFLKANCLTM